MPELGREGVSQTRKGGAENRGVKTGRYESKERLGAQLEGFKGADQD